MTDVTRLDAIALKRVDDLGRPSIAEQMKARINAEFATVEPGKRAALVLLVDESGVARMHVAAKFGENWKVAAGGGVRVKDPRRPLGYFGVVGSW